MDPVPHQPREPAAMAEECLAIDLEPGVRVTATVAYAENAARSGLILVFSPHPTLGGDADNNVVTALYRAGAAHGLPSVRFSYRGVETDSVAGVNVVTYWEQLEADRDYHLIVDDAAQVLARVRREFAADGALYFTGYSFGCYVALSLRRRLCPPPPLVGVSPPWEPYDYTDLLERPDQVSFIVGSDDPLCPRAVLAAAARQHGFAVLDFDCPDHFYRGAEDELARLAIGRLLDGR